MSKVAKLFFHHVGQTGSADFDKTVFKEVETSVLARTLDAETLENIMVDVENLFPAGRFNCLGVPEGDRSVIRDLTAGDYVLLVQSVRRDGFIPALCPVKLFLRSIQPALSAALWGSERYPSFSFSIQRN